MSNYRFYITNTHEGIIQGTNDEEKAKDMSFSEDFFVLDVQTNSCLVDGKYFYTIESI